MLSGTPIPAGDALTIGLVDTVVPSDKLLAEARRAALDLAAAVAAGTPGARRKTLQLTQHMQVPLGWGGGRGLAWLGCHFACVHTHTRAFLPAGRSSHS